MQPAGPVATLEQVALRYKAVVALDDVSLEIPAGRMVGLIGPDGVGKSSLLALLSGARAIQQGRVQVLGGDMARASHRRRVCPHIAYMPQGLGRNLYPTLSVEENLQFFARLFGHDAGERRRRIDLLTRSTGLHAFLARPAGQLSGGMKQKLGLCCALVHDPELLILDEPTTGVDPLARAQFWSLIERIRADRPGMSVVVATAYMEEAQGFDWLVALDGGRVLATGTPADLLARTRCESLEQAFIALLPAQRRAGHRVPVLQPLAEGGAQDEVAIEARGLTMRFGDFVAVDDVALRIRRGEIFGFLGSNGCGKTTTMKMLTGLLPATAGQAWLFGQPVDPRDMATRRRVGYMSQSFSLYGELTVRQNLALHARLFQVPPGELDARVDEMIERFGLGDSRELRPEQMPLGLRQRLSLAVAMVHRPELLILDEPTSGVDPIARDAFWALLIELARRDRVTIFISTHFMNEAQRCDRVSLMHAGRVLASDTPERLAQAQGVASLHEAFMALLRRAQEGEGEGELGLHPSLRKPIDNVAGHPVGWGATPAPPTPQATPLRQSLRRLYSYLWRESLELQRDPVRGALALLGSLLMMTVIGYGVSMDVNTLRFAVLDGDQTQLSRNYVLDLSGSRYFVEAPPLADHADLDRRMRAGEIALGLEIPPGFARDLARGQPVQIAAWVDGSMPQRAETALGYVQGMHQHWLLAQAREHTGALPVGLADVETRFRYNPDVKSLPAMVPAVVPMLLLMLPSMLAALAVVREKELGSILNFYVTPTTRLEFLLGKQVPYIVLGMLNFAIMTLAAVTVFGVPLTGSLATLTLAALLFTIVSTGLGLLASTVTRSQIAAIFITLVGTLLPAVQFAGLINPVASLEGAGRVIGELYPASHMFTISRGVFSKALGFGDLHAEFAALALAVPVVLGLAVALLRKQEK